MTLIAPKHLRLVGPAVVIAALTLGSLPAAAQTAPSTATGCTDLHFELANPSPGAMLDPGGYVVEGLARDARATSGAGVDRIDFFLGDRDEGGASLGSVIPTAATGPFGLGSFSTTVQLPTENGGHELFGYAHSSVTGQEARIDVPIVVGEEPSVAGETSTSGAVPSEIESCTAAPLGQTMTPATSTTPATTTTTTPATTATTPSTTTTTVTTPAMGASSLTLNVGNPDTGATILVGGYSIEGTAWDTAATSGVGVDRVDVFLDNRDEGGMFLGTAIPMAAASGMANGMWHLNVSLPSNQTGPHSLWFYAHSSVSGAEKSWEVPVTITN